jgi:hypothetical protein
VAEGGYRKWEEVFVEVSVKMSNKPLINLLFSDHIKNNVWLKEEHTSHLSYVVDN